MAYKKYWRSKLKKKTSYQKQLINFYKNNSTTNGSKICPNTTTRTTTNNKNSFKSTHYKQVPIKIIIHNVASKKQHINSKILYKGMLSNILTWFFFFGNSFSGDLCVNFYTRLIDKM